MSDWMIRSIKTFVQAFLGTLIPELCAVLNAGFPENWPAFWALTAPFVAAACRRASARPGTSSARSWGSDT